MAKTDNKLIFQSYIFTTAKYDFSVYEKRIIYRQIEIEQALLNNEALKNCLKVETSLWGDKRYTVPISSLLTSGDDKNYKRIQDAFESLRSKSVEYEDDEVYACFGVINSFEVKKYAKTVSWVSDKRIVEAVMDFTKGWRKYELKIAMQFESVYSMRIYELISGKRQAITYSIQEIEGIFKIEKKYRTPNGKLSLSNLRKFILDKSKAEMDKVSPYTFDYLISKDKKSVTFIPIYQKEKTDSKLKTIYEDSSNFDLTEVLSQDEIDVFVDEFGFSEQGLKNNYSLFEDCKKTLPPNYTFFMFQTIRIAIENTKKKNLQGFIIGIIKNMLNDFKNPKKRSVK